jgi:REP-associated tyrosine transposase
VARALRAFQAGIYHVGSHGSDERYLFLSDGEREVFLNGLGRVLESFQLGLVSYTLMGNHYHLLLRIPDARVSKAMQRLHTWYSRLHNKLNVSEKRCQTPILVNLSVVVKVQRSFHRQ